MIGFDRPLKPRWIYESLLLWRRSTSLRDFYGDFNQIVHELSGHEGKRKVRTVLFRYFWDFEGHSSSQKTTQESLLATVTGKASLDELKPSYLVILVNRSRILQEILANLIRLFPQGRTIITKQLIDNMVKMHGERDVVKRSARSFLTTLVNFGILTRSGENYEWSRKLDCSVRALAYVLIFFCIDNGRAELDLGELKHDYKFTLLNLSKMEDCAKRYNGTLWSYVRRPLTSKIVPLSDVRTKITLI